MGPRTHMRMRGLEPPRPERHTDLNRARLPIPPHPRADDSSRHHRFGHAASQPPPSPDVQSSMTRIFGLLCALALCALPRLRPERSASNHATGRSAEVVVTLSAPPLAGLTGSAARDRPGGPRSRAGAVQGRSRGRDPRRADSVALQHRPQRGSGRAAGVADPPSPSAARSEGGRPRCRLQRRLRHCRRYPCRDAPVADRAHQQGRGDEDRDHRRRDRPDPSLLLPRRLHDASRLPEGADVVHDREGDRRPRVRASGTTWRNARKPFDPLGSGHATHVAGIAAGNAGHAGRRRRHALRHRTAGVSRQLQGTQHPDGRGGRTGRQRPRDRRRHRGSRRRRHGRDQPFDRRARGRAVARPRRARARRRRRRRRRPRRRRR